MHIGSLTIVYGVVALLSVLLYIFYLLFDKKSNRLFLPLFGCVAAANCGYFLLSVSDSLVMARLANGLSYFGSAFAVLIMTYIIYEVCQLPNLKWFKRFLAFITLCAFAIAASADLFGLYYTAISIERVAGVTHLIKDYGPLHSIYVVYLGSYVLVMVGMIIYASKTKRLSCFRYTMFLLVAVLLNVGVWLVEQIFIEEFEMLSVSYIVTALLLRLIYDMLYDYGIINADSRVLSVQMLTQLNTKSVSPGELPPGMESMFNTFAKKAKTLSSAERRILQLYIEGHEIADIPELTYVSIHTVKKHNRSIYQKLEIASRDELMLYIELFRCCNRLDDLIADTEHAVTE